jgi:BolA protein
MMTMIDRIEEALAPLAPMELRIEDQSAQHRGHGGWREGGETHFDLYLVSASFRGQSRVARHRMVHDLVAPLMADRVHALAMRLLTPEEAAKG